MAAVESFSLRERKAARVKVGLAFAVRDRLPHSTLEEITVREICSDAQISEATFFNYFRRKTDVLLYLTQLITLELIACARQQIDQPTAFDRIRAFYAETARRMTVHPWVMQEVLAHQILMRQPPVLEGVTEVERLVAYPALDTSGIDSPQTVVDVLARHIEDAIRNEELPADTDPESAVVALFSVYFGVATALEWAPPETIGPMYENQLRTVWAGLKTSS